MKRAVTLKDVAKKAGVSINTVSRVLNGTNKENWASVARRAQEIRKIAASLGYQPNVAARAMRTSQTRHLAAVMSGSYAAASEYPVIMGINQRLQESGYALSVVSTSETGSTPARDAVLIRERFLCGAFLMHVPGDVREHVEHELSACIHVDSNVRTKTRCVYRDERYAGRLATQQVIAAGYSHIAYLGYRPWKGCHINVQHRLEGVRKESKKGGIPLDVLEVGFEPQDYMDLGERILPKLKRSTAVIASGQELAEWLSHICAPHSLIPGRDYGLATCAGNTHSSRVWPGLSRVSFDRYELGRRCADMMLDVVEDRDASPRSVALQGEWLPGNTLGQ